jgi:predicted ATPase with chaperone activity
VDGWPRIDEFLVAGELALDGRIRSIKGVISLALLAKQLKFRGVIVPLENASEPRRSMGFRCWEFRRWVKWWGCSTASAGSNRTRRSMPSF